MLVNGRPGLRLKVSSPEDTILMKLRWALQAGGSGKQVDDAAGVFEFQGDHLDQSYLDMWADTLAVSALLADVRSRAEAAAGPEAAGTDPAGR